MSDIQQTREMPMYQTDLELYESHHTNSLYKAANKRNVALRANFSSCFKLPEWCNQFAYFCSQPPRTERLVTWSTIRAGFGLRIAQLKVLKQLHAKSDRLGHLTEWSIKSVMTPKNFRRVLQRLIAAEVLQEVDSGIYTINPAIVYGRDWWSPFAQGHLITAWMNGAPVAMPNLDKVHQCHKFDLELGCREASRVTRRSWAECERRKLEAA